MHTHTHSHTHTLTHSHTHTHTHTHVHTHYIDISQPHPHFYKSLSTIKNTFFHFNPFLLSMGSRFYLFYWRHNIQHNDIQLNDIQLNGIQLNDIRHDDIQLNDMQQNDACYAMCRIFLIVMLCHYNKCRVFYSYVVSLR
jgi:hypothetical protein